MIPLATTIFLALLATRRVDDVDVIVLHRILQHATGRGGQPSRAGHATLINKLQPFTVDVWHTIARIFQACRIQQVMRQASDAVASVLEQDSLSNLTERR